MTKGDVYRLRAKGLARRMKGTSWTNKAVLAEKKKALDDMAEIEDWLEGKPGSQVRSKKE